MKAGRAALATALLVGSFAAAHASGGAMTLKVEVHEGGRTEPKIKMEMPLDVVEAFAASIREEALSHIQLDQIEQHGFDLRAFWTKVRESNVNEFFTLEADEAHVRGWREGGMFRLSVTADEGGDDGDSGDTKHVELRIPERVMDLIVTDGEQISPADLVAALRAAGPLTLVEVTSNDESVRVWIE